MHVYVSPNAFVHDIATGDFCCTEPGELLALWTCPCSDDSCQKESFTGLESHRATTVGVVVDRPDLDHGILLDLFCRDLVNRGWHDGSYDEELEDWLVDMVDDVTTTADLFGIGTSVRYNGSFWRVTPKLSLVK